MSVDLTVFLDYVELPALMVFLERLGHEGPQEAGYVNVASLVYTSWLHLDSGHDYNMSKYRTLLEIPLHAVVTCFELNMPCEKDLGKLKALLSGCNPEVVYIHISYHYVHLHHLNLKT